MEFGTASQGVMVKLQKDVVEKPPRQSRQGFTLIELMVSIAIIGALLALLLPAVQKVRATSRKLSCTNNLKQIGIAMHNIESHRGSFPSHGAEVYEDLSRAFGNPDSRARVSGFYCPADPLTQQPSTGSYLMNSGTKFRTTDQYRNGYHTMFRPRRAADFSDGQSVTAAFSERLVAPAAQFDDNIRANSERFPWWTEKLIPHLPLGNEAAFVEQCQSARVSQTPGSFFLPDTMGFGYDHFLGPNHPACWNGPVDLADRNQAIVPASSLHTGGVNVLFVDGHVQLISENIALDVWRAIGSINGQETVTLPN